MFFSGYFFLNKNFLYLFLEKGEGKEKGKKRNISVWLPLTQPLLGTWPSTQACALTGNRTSDPLACSLALNPLSHSSQGSWVIQFLVGEEDLPNKFHSDKTG